VELNVPREVAALQRLTVTELRRRYAEVFQVHAQANNLGTGSPARRRLVVLTGEVKSGDPTNIEAQASRIYWSAWLDGETAFRRDVDAEDSINAMLNYGYAVVRAAVARALVCAELHPALGLHHCNRSNAFSLADDLLEPLRPMVDRTVRELQRTGRQELDRPAKVALLGLLTTTVRVGDQTGPLMVGLHRTVASLVRCFEGTDDRLLLPVFCGAGE
jgi:CRISPR-associated protein Cas1